MSACSWSVSSVISRGRSLQICMSQKMCRTRRRMHTFRPNLASSATGISDGYATSARPSPALSRLTATAASNRGRQERAVQADEVRRPRSINFVAPANAGPIPRDLSTRQGGRHRSAALREKLTFARIPFLTPSGLAKFAQRATIAPATRKIFKVRRAGDARCLQRWYRPERLE